MATRAQSDVAHQYRLLKEAVGLFDRSDRGKLDVTGPDAYEYLQGQVTNEVESLEPGRGCYTAILTPKGRILADLRVFAVGPEELWLDTEPAALEAVLADLRTYKIGRRVELADRTGERALLSLIGPTADEVARWALDPTGALVLPRDEHSFVAGEIEGAAVTVVRTDVGLDVFAASHQVERTAEALLSLGAALVGDEAVEIVRIESGRPRYGVDMNEDNFPAEAGIVERAVSFTKGCYVGQEPVARMQYKGHPNRHLRGLELSRPASPGQPFFVAGTQAGLPAGREVGFVSSACVSPAFGPIALALVRREVAPGTAVTLGEDGPSATVVELPFEARKLREFSHS
jgi:tRNA-modifying protein YgfZ